MGIVPLSPALSCNEMNLRGASRARRRREGGGGARGRERRGRDASPSERDVYGEDTEGDRRVESVEERCPRESGAPAKERLLLYIHSHYPQRV